MVEDVKTDGAIVVGDSIFMMVECNSQDGENEANQQEIEKLFAHPANNLPICKEKEMRYKLYFLRNHTAFLN
jgi:hypothetical protein